jgi:hypothetical protein
MGLFWLPDITIGSWDMRKIDILADLRPDSASEDSVASIIPKAKLDSCKPGITCIEDMADASERGMEPLYAAIDNINSLGRPVRIAVLGDSYIEGDILTADLRELLQKRYGGSGVGYLPITTITAGFRRSVRQTFSGWTSHHANDPGGYSSTWSNLTGHYFFAEGSASVSINGVSNYLSRLDTCQRSTLYYLSSGHANVTASINGGAAQSFSINPTPGVGSLSVNGKIGRVTWKIGPSGHEVVYLGASMDCDKGVVVDNFSLRSSSGRHLDSVTDKMFQDFDAARHYDLVILMYGLNVANKSASGYKVFSKHLASDIERMKRTMPGTGFLVIGVGDREQRTASGLKTMRGIVSLISVQQRLAFNSRVAFWNLYDAMGGEGSMANMVNARPQQANLDYTHINFNGGHKLAKLLFDAIEWGQECYHKQNGKEGGAGK